MARASFRQLQTQSDNRLAALAGDGDARAFEELVLRYRTPLLAYARRLASPAVRPEDVVQQGLLYAWSALQRGHRVREVRPWLFRIVRNTALRMLHAGGGTHDRLGDATEQASEVELEADLERRIATQETLSGVAALPAQQRAALLYTAVDGLSHRQVAAILGLSDGAVRGLLYRARKSLRRATGALAATPLACWAARAVDGAATVAQRGAGLGAGTTDIPAALLRGGVIAFTAGALVAGGAAIHARVLASGSRSAQASNLGAARPRLATSPARAVTAAPIGPPREPQTTPAARSRLGFTPVARAPLVARRQSRARPTTTLPTAATTVGGGTPPAATPLPGAAVAGVPAPSPGQTSASGATTSSLPPGQPGPPDGGEPVASDAASSAAAAGTPGEPVAESDTAATTSPATAAGSGSSDAPELQAAAPAD